MKLYVFPPSGRVVALIALKNHLQIDCEIVSIDLCQGEQRNPQYSALNPNRKIPVLCDRDIVLWESNAILFYLASTRPESGLWPTDTARQSDVLRWLFWQSAHWDAESCGMVAYERASKGVLGAGPPDPAFIARGEQNFDRFAAVLNDSLAGRIWLTGDQLTIADFSIAGLVPTAERFGLPVSRFPEVLRWYEGLNSLPAWKDALTARRSAIAAFFARGAAADELPPSAPTLISPQ